jgi:hypothetical protein
MGPLARSRGPYADNRFTSRMWGRAYPKSSGWRVTGSTKLLGRMATVGRPDEVVSAVQAPSTRHKCTAYSPVPAAPQKLAGHHCRAHNGRQHVRIIANRTSVSPPSSRLIRHTGAMDGGEPTYESREPPGTKHVTASRPVGKSLPFGRANRPPGSRPPTTASIGKSSGRAVTNPQTRSNDAQRSLEASPTRRGAAWRRRTAAR